MDHEEVRKLYETLEDNSRDIKEILEKAELQRIKFL